MKSSPSLLKFAPALLAAQKVMGAAEKGSTNPFFKSKYADLGAVMEACKEALNSNGISVLQPVGTDETGVYVETILLHESGEFVTDKMRISVKGENNPQAQGSAITYARRYGLQSMVFVPAEDDDAEKATPHSPGVTVKPMPVSQPARPDMSEAFNAKPVSAKCELCGTTNQYHKPGCPNDPNREVVSV